MSEQKPSLTWQVAPWSRPGGVDEELQYGDVVVGYAGPNYSRGRLLGYSWVVYDTVTLGMVRFGSDIRVQLPDVDTAKEACISYVKECLKRREASTR